jgi:hypothetical protein
VGETSTVEEVTAEDVHEHLDAVEELTYSWEEWDDTQRQAAARSIYGLTRTMRAVLMRHQAERPGDLVDTMRRVLRDPENEFTRIVQETWAQ